MSKTAEETEREQAITEVLAELKAMPPGKTLSSREWYDIVKRLPKLGTMPEGWSSAEDIREMRGPLPEDDPDFQRRFGRR
ncbi:MAG TPA: hypothetical protein VEO54_31820 [Thermoanaerobaculia bacterium]|nr:hypothetical protein [Thermoanaerobaculia bacterium]